MKTPLRPEPISSVPTISIRASASTRRKFPTEPAFNICCPPAQPDFPLEPAGPLFVGSGKSRTQVLPVGIGSLGRNVVRAPGQLDLNVSVGRSFVLRERVQFTIRMEAYNALNHTNFQAPNSILTLTTNSVGSADLELADVRGDYRGEPIAIPAIGGQIRFLTLRRYSTPSVTTSKAWPEGILDSTSRT